jgi:hypothetical protein
MADDLQGLPDVDLTPVLDSLEQSAPKEEPSVRTETKPTEELDLGQFKNPKDLLKSYKEIQAAFTRVTQENKSHKEKEIELAQLREQVELLRSSANRPIHQEPQKRFDEAFVENPEAAIQQRITQTVMTSRIAEVLEEEAEKNRDDFNERYAYAQQVAQQYPQLATSPTGVKKLFQFGDKLRHDALKKNASKALESIFGEPLAEEEIAKLRKMVKGDKAIKQTTNKSDAYMPDTSTSTRSGSESGQRNADIEIEEYSKKGDIDGTIAALFKKQMAE